MRPRAKAWVATNPELAEAMRAVWNRQATPAQRSLVGAWLDRRIAQGVARLDDQAIEVSGAAEATRDTLSCPECGRPFTRAGPMAAHRRFVHDVKGERHRKTAPRPSASAPLVADQAVLLEVIEGEVHVIAKPASVVVLVVDGEVKVA